MQGPSRSLLACTLLFRVAMVLLGHSCMYTWAMLSRSSSVGRNRYVVVWGIKFGGKHKDVTEFSTNRARVMRMSTPWSPDGHGLHSRTQLDQVSSFQVYPRQNFLIQYSNLITTSTWHPTPMLPPLGYSRLAEICKSVYRILLRARTRTGAVLPLATFWGAVLYCTICSTRRKPETRHEQVEEPASETPRIIEGLDDRNGSDVASDSTVIISAGERQAGAA
jgi:hypothetical protein